MGYAGWAADHGNAWDGWSGGGKVNIDFNFGAKTKIDTVEIGSTQDHPGQIALPSINIFSSNDGNNWSFVNSLIIPANPANNVDLWSTSAHGFLSLTNLGINNNFVRVQAIANSPWIFIDEVKFSSNQNTTATPVPAAVWLFGSGLAGLIAIRRRNKLAA